MRAAAASACTLDLRNETSYASQLIDRVNASFYHSAGLANLEPRKRSWTRVEAHHDILLVREPVKGARTITADVVCPVWETGDYLALDRNLPERKAGDLWRS